MAKKQEFKQETVSSFDDIITCLAGILFLMIISVTLDIRPPTIFTPTPIDQEDTEKRPIYIECTTDGSMLPVDVSGLRTHAEEEIQKLVSTYGEDRLKVLSEIGKLRVTNEFYRIDAPALMTSQSAVLTPVSQKRGGEKLPDNIEEITQENWLSKLYTGMDTNKEYIVFLVRSSDASYDIFRRARAYAWLKNIPVAYELFDNADPFEFGRGSILSTKK